MVKIYWNPPLAGTAGKPESDIPVRRPESVRRMPSRGEDPDSRTLNLSRADPLATLLENRLKSFQKALDRFRWPADGFGARRGRVVVRDPDLEGRADAVVTNKADYGNARYYKSFSRGLTGSDKTGLDPGTYEFKITLGGDSESFSVEVDGTESNDELLDALAEGINASSLSVTAEVIRQTGPGVQVEGLVKTGSILALSVNQGFEDQDLAIADTSGHLVTNHLMMEETVLPVGPADAKRYDVEGIVNAHPGVFTSRAFDPNEETSLTPGKYSIAVTLGGSSAVVDMSVEEGDDWRDVLSNTALAIEGTGLARADVIKQDRVSTLVTDPSRNLLMEGVALEVSAVNPKAGERLSISGGEHLSSGTFTVEEVGDDTIFVTAEQWEGMVDGTKVEVVAGDSATLPGGLSEDTDYYLNKYDQVYEKTEDPATRNLVRFSTIKAGAESGTDIVDLTSEGSGTFSLDGGNLFDTVGMVTASPGTDAVIRVNGREYVRSPAVVTQDTGKTNVVLEDNFGESLPLSVLEAMEGMESAMRRVVDEYDSLQTFLERNAQVLEGDLARAFREPVEDRLEGLEWMGFKEWGRSRTLTLDADRFYEALGENPDRAYGIVAGERGLVEAWKEKVEETLDQEAATLVREESGLVSTYFSTFKPESELEIEKKNRLVDLLG